MSEKEAETGSHHHEVRIHIDQKVHHAPNRISADALYALGHVKTEFVLYREVAGDKEGEIVRRGEEIIHLHEDEHFHSGPPPEITIIVEGTEHEWFKPEITYDEVATLFDPAFPQHPEINYAITYANGPNHKPEGILTRGARVRVKGGMEFHVSTTGQS